VRKHLSCGPPFDPTKNAKPLLLEDFDRSQNLRSENQIDTMAYGREALAKCHPAKQGGDVPDFVEVDEAGIAVDHAMRHQRLLQPSP